MKFILVFVLVFGIFAQAPAKAQSTRPNPTIIGTWNFDGYYCSSGKKVDDAHLAGSVTYGPANEFSVKLDFRLNTIRDKDKAVARATELQKNIETNTATNADADKIELAAIKEALEGTPCNATVEGEYAMRDLILLHSINSDETIATCKGSEKPAKVNTEELLQESGLPGKNLFDLTGSSYDTLEFDLTNRFGEKTEETMTKLCGNKSDRVALKLRKVVPKNMSSNRGSGS